MPPPDATLVFCLVEPARHTLRLQRGTMASPYRAEIDDISIEIDTIKLDMKVCEGCGRRFLGRSVAAYCTKDCQMETRKRDNDVKDLSIFGKMLDSLIQ